MVLRNCIAALAIEDRVDFWVYDGSEVRTASRDIPEQSNYIDAVRTLIAENISEVTQKYFPNRAHELFDAIESFVVSVAGVISDNRVLEQVPLWNYYLAGYTSEQRRHSREEVTIDFQTTLRSVALEIVRSQEQRPWPEKKADLFAMKIFVVNDATAAAAAEYVEQPNGENNDFHFIKIHNGLNVGRIEENANGWFEIASDNSEYGHNYPVPHPLDWSAEFEGVCEFHNTCTEGYVAGYALLMRAKMKHRSAFTRWADNLSRIKPKIAANPTPTQPNQYLERRFVHAILGDPKYRSDQLDESVISEGVDVVAHYLAQVAYSLILSPTSGRVIVGGRMAKNRVIEAAREKIIGWSNGYPRRKSLTADGIKECVVRAEQKNKKFIEVMGALTIALAYRDPDYKERIKTIRKSSALLPLKARIIDIRPHLERIQKSTPSDIDG